MAIKFLYIDDEKNSTVEGIKKNLSIDPSVLEITFEPPCTWNKQIVHLVDEKKLDQYDGLLLDLKLEFSADGDKLKYFGPDLAQALRTKIKSHNIKDLPILLCTTDDILLHLFDKTSVDLFDRTYRKEKDFNNPNVVSEFVSFANAYKELNSNKTLEELLIASDASVISEAKLEFINLNTSHEKSNFIFNQIINSPGILIDENILAIRMGIDISNSEDWEQLKSSLSKEFAYKGIFGKTFLRWWQYPIINWWKETFKKSLQTLGAADKVSLIKSFTGLEKLNPISLPPHHKYSSFWYKCRLSNTALESADGMRTIEMPKYVWQEPNYISLNYIMSEERDVKRIRTLLGKNELIRFNEILLKQRN